MSCSIASHARLVRANLTGQLLQKLRGVNSETTERKKEKPPPPRGTPAGAGGAAGLLRPKPTMEAEGFDSYYAILGIRRDASQSDVRKAYRHAAVKNHPDKGGDAAAFKACAEAYEVLSDPDMRRVYDRYGKAGLSNGAGMPERTWAPGTHAASPVRGSAAAGRVCRKAGSTPAPAWL